MLNMNALEIINSVALPSSVQLAKDPNGLRVGAFNLACVAEQFEQIVSAEYKGLAEALRHLSNKFFELSSQGPLVLNVEMLTNPECLYKLFEKIENVFFCINEFYFAFSVEDWRLQVAWRNVQDSFQKVRATLIRKAQAA
jgi:hypothetical protein